MGNPITLALEVPTATSQGVAGNPFAGLVDKVTLGRLNYSLGDRYEPWPKDPKDDFEKQKRREWLRGEVDRLKECIRNLEYSKTEKDRAAYSLGNEAESLKNEGRRVAEEINSVDEQRAAREIELGRTKRAHREAQERNDSNEAWRLLEKIHRLEDEVSNLRSKVQDLRWKRQELDNKAGEKLRERERLQGESYRIAEQISKERWTLQEREAELRNLGGYY